MSAVMIHVSHAYTFKFIRIQVCFTVCGLLNNNKNLVLTGLRLVGDRAGFTEGVVVGVVVMMMVVMVVVVVVMVVVVVVMVVVRGSSFSALPSWPSPSSSLTSPSSS